MKGIAIQTILMLLVGILVVGIIVYLVYMYMFAPGLKENDCRAQLVSWCTTCGTLGWKGGWGLSPAVAKCTSTYFGYTVNSGVDCDDGLTSGATCTNAGAASYCPNSTICASVGVGTST